MNSFIRTISILLVWILHCCFLVNMGMAQTVPDIAMPDTYAAQQVKGLVWIYSNLKTPGRDLVLAHNTNTNTIYWTDKASIPVASQLWFIVQDYEKEAFALVNASDKAWLYVDQFITNSWDSLGPHLHAIPNPPLNSDGYAKSGDFKCYFYFKLPNFKKVYNQGLSFNDSTLANLEVTGRPKLYSIYFNEDERYLMQNIDNSIRLRSHTFMRPNENAAAFTFRLESYQIMNSSFIAVPFQASSYHTNEVLTVGGSEKLSRLSRNTQSGNKPKDVLLSCHAFVRELKNDTLLKLDLSGADSAYIGWLSYEKASYSQYSVQNHTGDRAVLPRFGIGVANNKVYAIKDGFADTLSTATTFRKNYPLIISVESGKMKVSQSINGTSSSTIFYDVPVHSILSKGIGGKSGLVARLQAGDTLLVGYKPGNWLFSNSTAGTQEPFITSTNPDMPLSPSPLGLVNNFDWRAKTYKLRYKSNGIAVTEMVNSPFLANYPEFRGISAQYNASGQHLGGEDNNPYSGWELIKADLGYKNDGSQLEPNQLRAEPYIILYNRYRGKLRVLVYLNNNSIANNYKLTLSVANLGMYGNDGIGTNGKYKPPFLWSSYLNGKPLDDTTLTAPDYYKAQQLNSSSSGRFYYTDFQMNYDPCVAFFESAIQVKVDKLTQGTMSIVGRSLGGSIPGGAAINDWMSKNSNFLTGALNSNYGSLSQTMGDLTFNNYKQWGVDSMKNYANFTLPGKKVSPWEREEAYLKWTSESTKAAGTFIVASGTLLGGIGEAADAAGSIPFIGPVASAGAKQIKAAGKFMEASGKFMEASGTAISARANELRYENLKDAPDVNIPIKMPDPQPSLVYSDLALQGTLNIQSPVFSNVFFTTPGSRNAKYAPEFRPGTGAKGDFPLYNEPLGLYNLLATPAAGLAISGRTAQIALKEYPVVALNGRIAGAPLMIPAVQLAVTTYDTSGVARTSAATRAYVLMDDESGLDSSERLPAISEVGYLIDWETLDSNIYKSGGNMTDAQYEAKLSKWVKVSLIINYNLFAGKSPDGNYEGSVTTMTFPAGTDIKASFTGTIPATTLAAQFGYSRSNNAFFGTHHVINGTDTTTNIQNLMNTYCNTHQASQIRTQANTMSGTLPAIPGDTDISGMKVSDDLKLYPNPTQGECNLVYLAPCKGQILIELFDINGRSLVQHRDYAAMNGERKNALVHLGSLVPGVYVVKVRFGNGRYYTGKIVKQ